MPNTHSDKVVLYVRLIHIVYAVCVPLFLINIQTMYKIQEYTFVLLKSELKPTQR